MAVDSTDVVFGATGGIGGPVVAELSRRGRQVRAVSRRGEAPEGAEGVAADAAHPTEAAATARGAGVVYHTASFLEAEFSVTKVPRHVRGPNSR
jgi:uncharacterized protein YbjT (DUF2867 family)